MRKRIVGGTLTTITESDHKIHAIDGNINYAAHGVIEEIGSENGVSYGEPEERETIIGKWTSDEAGNNEISTAEIYEVVYFHFELINTSNNSGTANLHLNATYEKQVSAGPGDGMATFTSDLVIEGDVEVNGGKGYIKLDLVTELEKEYYISSTRDLQDPKKKYHATWRYLTHKGIYNLFWNITLNNRNYNISNKKLAMFIDDHCMNIMVGGRGYTCKAGWLDKKHAFISDWSETTSLDGLWIQLLRGNEGSDDYYTVTYIQGQIIGIPLASGHFLVKSRLNHEILKSIAVGILEKVSLKYEGLQYSLGHDSGFEPADLVGNVIGLNSRFRLYADKSNISKSDEEKRNLLTGVYNNMMSELNGKNTRESLEIYRQYPGSFTREEYKVKTLTPRYFSNSYCEETPQIPENYVMTPFPMGKPYYTYHPGYSADTRGREL